MDDFARVKDAVDLVDVVSRYVPLRRAGTRMVGLCPFHAEKTPSFGIQIGQRFFKCFGCGKGGDVFAFVAEIERVDKVEVLKRLADEAGIALSNWSSQEREERDRLLRVLADAQDLFRRALQSEEVGSAARALVAARRLTPAIVDAFGIGYAPGSGFGSAIVANRLVKAGHRREDVVAAGVAGEREGAPDGALFDSMRDRLTIPIRDERGRVIAFGGRRMSDGPDAPPAKYVNTRETSLFNKSRVLFGLDRARTAILRDERVVLVEGYLDVILAHQGGLENAIAALGTSVTADHARHLRRLAPQAVLFLDGDDAGQRAAERAVPLLLSAALDARVLVLKQDKDPGDYFARGATLADFSTLLKHEGVGGIDFLLERHGLRRAGSFEERMQVARAVAEALAPIDEPLTRKTLMAHVARQLDLPLDGILGALGRVVTRRTLPPSRTVGAESRHVASHGASLDAAPPGANEGESAEPDRKVPPERIAPAIVPRAQVVAEEELLIAMLSDPGLRAAAMTLVPEGTIVDPLRALLFRGLAASPAADAKQLVEGLLADCSGESEAQQILLDLVSRPVCADTAGKLFDGAIRWFERQRRAQKRDQLLADFRPRLNSGDADAAREFLREYDSFRRSHGAS